MRLDEAFWAEHAQKSASALARLYPDRFDNAANWRRARRAAKAKYPWLFEDDEAVCAAIPQNHRFQVYSEPASVVIFGLCGDTHGSSSKERNDALCAFYDVCKSEGVTDVLHTGDITAGDRVYPGQMYELTEVGFDAQVDAVVRRYPRREGIITRFITGNHDLSHFKHTGADIGKRIAADRDDMVYLGRYGATVELIPGFDIYLLHQDGGVPYAKSYKRQKIVEGFIGGTKPRIFASGHDHQQINFDYRNVQVYGTGCFEGQTEFLRRKGIEPVIGGWIIEAKLDSNGAIRRIRSEFVKFYENY